MFFVAVSVNNPYGILVNYRIRTSRRSAQGPPPSPRVEEGARLVEVAAEGQGGAEAPIPRRRRPVAVGVLPEQVHREEDARRERARARHRQG